MFKKLKLKNKITLSVVLSAIILSILVSVSVYFYLNKNLINEKLKDIKSLNIEQVHESEKIFKNEETFAKMLGSRTRVKEYLLNPTEERRVELLGIFNEYAKEDLKYLSLYLLDKTGKAVISTDPTFVGQDYSFRDYYKNGMNGESSMDILLGKTSNKFGYYFSYPVIDNGDTIGVFVSKINNEEIENAILKSEVSVNSSLMLVDKFGIVIISDKDERFLKSLGELNKEEKIEIKESKKFLDKNITPLQYGLVQDSIRNKKISEILKFYDEKEGETEILNINKIGKYPFYLVSEVGIETINFTILKTILILIGLIVLAVILSAFILYRLILVSISPIKDLKFFAQNIADGDFSKRIDVITNDEFGQLSATFNKMADNLSDLYDNLDEKVKEKTKKLEESEEYLKKTLNDSERINKLMIGRELEMINLKKEIIELKNKK